MREMKFRAWLERSSSGSRMEYLPELQYYGQEFCKTYADLDDERGGAVLMQFTGLKDKNGQEIYEGDILCWPQYEYDVRYEPIRFVVQWLAEEARFSNWDPRGGPEVIGNIYENPEFLTPQSRK
jgi:YopX protein